MRTLRRIIQPIFVALVVLMAASFAGAIHPMGDLIAVFRFWIALAVMACVVVLVRGWKRAFAGAALVLAGFSVDIAAALGPAAAARSGQYTLYQKNILFNNSALPQLAQDIRARAPDFVTLQEVSATNLWLLRDLQQTYITSLFCAGSNVSALAVLARYPRSGAADICRDDAGLAAVQVLTPDGPLWLVSLHLRWPWPYQQPENLRTVIPLLESLDQPVVIAGDFNAVAWSHAVSQVSTASGTRRFGPIFKTFKGPNIFLNVPIDHILSPGGDGALETRPYLGSDHLGLLARFDL